MHGFKCFSFYYAIIRIFCSKDFDFLHLYDVEILIIRNIFVSLFQSMLFYFGLSCNTIYVVDWEVQFGGGQ